MMVEFFLDDLFESDFADVNLELELDLGVLLCESWHKGRENFFGWKGFLFGDFLPLLGDKFIDLIKILVSKILELGLGNKVHGLQINEDMLLKVLTKFEILNVLNVLIYFSRVRVKH